MTTCKNCAAEYEGKFCPNCGQKAKTSRITFRQVFKDIRDQFVHFDQGFLYTIKELALRPGHSIREYVEGKRVRHVKPIKFMIWAAAISFFIAHFLGFQEHLVQRLQAENEAQGRSTQSTQKLVEFIMGHPNILMLMTIPTIAFCAWLFFRKKRLNYAEYFSINAFLMGQLSIFSIATNIGFAFWRDLTPQHLALIGVLQWCVWTTYFGWAYSQFFNQPKKVIAWLKGVFVLMTGYILLILIIGLLATTVMYFFKPQIEAWLAN